MLVVSEGKSYAGFGQYVGQSVSTTWMPGEAHVSIYSVY